MRNGKGALLTLFGGCTAFLWRYAWAVFFSDSLFGRHYPFVWAATLFCFPFIVAVLSSGRGWRNLAIALVHAAALVVPFFSSIHSFFAVEQPFYRLSWIAVFFRTPRQAADWLTLFLYGVLSLLFWAGGLFLARKRRGYAAYCARLDIGTAFFFLLFLTKMLFRIKGGADPQDAGSLDFFFPFMIFGVSGVALSKKKGGAEREFMNRHRGTGIVLASAALIVATTVGFILLAMPVLNMAADTGYGIIRAIARPCGNLLIAILRFIFRRPSADSGAGEGGSDDLGPVMDTTGGEGFFQIIVRYCVIGLTIAAGVFLVLFLGWLLVRWLLSRTRRDDRERNGSGTAGLFSLLKRFACMIRELILRVCTVFTGGNRGIVDIYLAFLRWGRRGGLPRGISETPREYGVRLSVAYPFAAGEIDRITGVFNQYYFGRAQLRRAEADELKDGNEPPGPVPAAATAGAAPDGASGADPGSYMLGELTAGGEERARAASMSAAALRRLRNPAFFLPRLKVWISR